MDSQCGTMSLTLSNRETPCQYSRWQASMSDLGTPYARKKPGLHWSQLIPIVLCWNHNKIHLFQHFRLYVIHGGIPTKVQSKKMYTTRNKKGEFKISSGHWIILEHLHSQASLWKRHNYHRFIVLSCRYSTEALCRASRKNSGIAKKPWMNI